jgi:hypothetical protein
VCVCVCVCVCVWCGVNRNQKNKSNPFQCYCRICFLLRQAYRFAPYMCCIKQSRNSSNTGKDNKSKKGTKTRENGQKSHTQCYKIDQKYKHKQILQSNNTTKLTQPKTTHNKHVSGKYQLKCHECTKKCIQQTGRIILNKI